MNFCLHLFCLYFLLVVSAESRNLDLDDDNPFFQHEKPYIDKILLKADEENQVLKITINWMNFIFIIDDCILDHLIIDDTVSFTDLDLRFRNDYFWVGFDHFWGKLHFLRQLGQ